MTEPSALQPMPLTAMLLPSELSEMQMPESYAALRLRAHEQASRLNVLEDECDALNRELASRDETHSAQLEKAVEAAREEGRSDAEQTSARILDAAMTALETCQADFKAFLSVSEALAVELIDDAIHMLSEDPSQTRRILSEAIHASVKRIGEAAVVNIRLNPDDFQSTADFEPEDGHNHYGGTGIGIDPLLSSGEAVLELLIGTHEISLPRHWCSVRSLLGEARDGMSGSPDVGEASG